MRSNQARAGAALLLCWGLSACASDTPSKQLSSPEQGEDAAIAAPRDSDAALPHGDGGQRDDDAGIIVPDDGAIPDAGEVDGRSGLAAPQQLNRVGVVLDDDSTIWCQAEASGAKHGVLDVYLRRTPSDALAAIEEPYRFTQGRARGRIKCTAQPDGGGEHTTVTTEPSTDADDDRGHAQCPVDMPFGRDLECSIEPHDEAAREARPQLRYVYMPAPKDEHDVPFSVGGRCIGSISESQPLGQVTGFVPEYLNASGGFIASLPLENKALMEAAQVGGTDEGAIFYAQGKLWFVFGDTSALDANDPLTVALQGPGLWRSNVLAYSQDFDARDGFQFDGFETVANSEMAAERVLSPHDTMPGEGAETTAIPLAGFGFTSEAGERYRFLWFVSINTWDPNLVGPAFTANYSSLAYVEGDDPTWTRLPAPPSPPHADFGPGTVWFDRYERQLYFFGVTPDRGALKLARVASTFDEIVDPEAYEYWNGESWVLGDASVAAALIEEKPTYAPRSELSIAWNPAAQVWMMMVVNWYSAATPPNQVELWQAPAVIGPWQKVDADAQLPNGQHVLQYGPMLSEHLLADDGLEVPYLLSQLFPVYNVYHHSYRITVADGSACPSVH
jgi:hypothetical protein